MSEKWLSVDDGPLVFGRCSISTCRSSTAICGAFQHAYGQATLNGCVNSKPPNLTSDLEPGAGGLCKVPTADRSSRLRMPRPSESNAL